jgi:hypothetical protein
MVREHSERRAGRKPESSVDRPDPDQHTRKAAAPFIQYLL